MSDIGDYKVGDYLIEVNLARQDLRLLRKGRLLFETAVSTAAKGAGERRGSEQTPRGQHIIRARIGSGAPVNTVFVGRRPTGEIYTEELAKAHPGRDWILTRILWLSGTEVGRNRLGEVDTMQRHIYLHGCPDSVSMGTPGSHGCVRLRNQDMITLFDLTPLYCPVWID